VKVVILAGGTGSRLGEITETWPKPMVTVGGRPILWHIMKIYSAAGLNDFVICLGYKGDVIRNYFANYHLYSSDCTIDLANNSVEYFNNSAEPWRITLLETGPDTQTGGRLKRAQQVIGNEICCFTYGDAVADIDVRALIDFHQAGDSIATVSGIQAPSRFGALAVEGDRVLKFDEKPFNERGLINGGFFILSPRIFDYIEGDNSIFELDVLPALSAEDRFRVYRHTGFWQCMDTPRDRQLLENLWAEEEAPWKIWKPLV